MVFWIYTSITKKIVSQKTTDVQNKMLVKLCHNGKMLWYTEQM